ncbi:patatin-like phospholipase domain-containing protein 4 [Aulostomus maculatus]
MVLKVSTCHSQEGPPSISFSGSGFLATYQFGVAQCFLNYAPWLLQAAPCVLGASAGSLVAASVVCEMNLITMRDEMLHFAKQMKDLTLGPLNPSINVFHWLEHILRKYLPSDAHQLATGRLAVAMTRLSDGKQIVKSEYQSKEEVLQALLCSCFVPGYCGMLPPSLDGVHYMDGGFSGMQPILALPGDTLTVSPFSGEIDICPADRPCMWDMVVTGLTLKGSFTNGFRFFNALYPLALETLEQAYHSGYKDGLHFLRNNELFPDMMTNKLSPAPCIYYKTSEEEEEMAMEKEMTSLTSFEVSKCVQTHGSTEHQLNGKQTIKEPPLTFDTVKNALQDNLVSYGSMLGLPARILTYLLLPLMLSFYTVLQSRHRLAVFFREAPALVLWAFYGLRQYSFFFFSILYCTMQKNIKDRVMPIVLLLQWLKVKAEYKPPRQKSSSSALSADFRHGSLQERLIAPGPMIQPNDKQIEFSNLFLLIILIVVD